MTSVGYMTYYLCGIMHCIALIFLLGQLGTAKKGLILPTIVYIGPIIILSILDYLLQLPITRFMSALWSLFGFILSVMLFEGKPIRKLLLFLSISLILSIAQVFGGVFGIIAFGKEPFAKDTLNMELAYDSYVLNASRLLLGSALIVLSILAAILFRFRKERIRSRALWMMLMISLTHLVFLCVYYRINRNEASEWNNFIQLIFQLLLFIMLIYQYYSTLRTHCLLEAEKTLKAVQSQRESEYHYYKLADSKFTEISQLRHDIQNQMQAVKVLMQSKDGSAQAAGILNCIEERLDSMKAVNYCDNHIINAVLTVKLNEEVCRNIRTEIVLKDCGDLPFDDYDLCSLVSNLFDNAVEGGQVCDEPFIELRSGIRGEFFLLKVINSCRSENFTRTSTKSDEGHGYGLQITEEICKKYHGNFTLRTEGDTAVALAALKFF